VGNGGFAGLEWFSASDMSDSYNVMIVTETGAKYQTNVLFSNGSASLDWDSMSPASMEMCGILTLSNFPSGSSPYEVFVTGTTLDDTSTYYDAVTNRKASGYGSRGFAILGWNSVSDMSGSYSILIEAGTEARYANGVSFSNGSASLNWNDMPVASGIGSGGGPGPGPGVDPEPGFTGTLSLSHAPGYYVVLVTSAMLDSSSTDESIIADFSNLHAYCQEGSGSSASLTWISGYGSGSYNVLIVTGTEARYQNYVSFSDGSASLDWDTMSAASMDPGPGPGGNSGS
jgi:hypothetical protein